MRERVGRNMSDPELIEGLISFGLSPLQAESYVALVVSGPLSAQILAEIVQINKSDAYRVLKTLRKLGIVEVELSQKSYFFAVPPEDALESLLERKESELDELRTSKRILCELLENARRDSQRNPEVTVEPFFRLVTGSQVFNRWAEAMTRAKTSIVKVMPSYTLPTHYLKLSDIEAEMARKVTVTVVTEITDENSETAKRYYEKIKILHATGLNSSFRYLILDSREAFLGGTPLARGASPSINDHVVLWTNNSVIVEACTKDFQSVLERAIDPIQGVWASRHFID